MIGIGNTLKQIVAREEVVVVEEDVYSKQGGDLRAHSSYRYSPQVY